MCIKLTACLRKRHSVKISLATTCRQPVPRSARELGEGPGGSGNHHSHFDLGAYDAFHREELPDYELDQEAGRWPSCQRRPRSTNAASGLRLQHGVGEASPSDPVTRPMGFGRGRVVWIVGRLSRKDKRALSM